MTESRRSALNIRSATLARRALRARPDDPRSYRRGEEPGPPRRAGRTPQPAGALPGAGQPDPAVRTPAARVRQ